MDIRLLENNDQPKAKSLWKQAFGDSEAFINWYFGNKILPGNSLGMFESGELICVVHTIPYTIRVQQRPLQTAFIAGAATLKRRQGQGHMKRLLYETLTLLRSRGILLTHLYPFKHAFYENFGWATYSHVSRQTVTALPYRRSSEVVETGDSLILSALYERMMRSFDGYVVRTEREWAWRLEELSADGGRVALLLEDGCARAYMLYYAEDNKANVIETVYTHEEDIGGLLGYILGQGFESVTYTVPDQGKGAEKFGMVRVVDARALLTAFDAEGLLDHVHITDDFAAWNNCGNDGGNALDIGSLGRLVHCGADRKTSENTGRFFAPQRTCIFETY